MFVFSPPPHLLHLVSGSLLWVISEYGAYVLSEGRSSRPVTPGGLGSLWCRAFELATRDRGLCFLKDGFAFCGPPCACLLAQKRCPFIWDAPVEFRGTFIEVFPLQGFRPRPVFAGHLYMLVVV